MFAFSASFSGIPALWYVYIIINSLQGLYIFFAFVFNRRIGRLWSQKLGLTNVEESISSKKIKTGSSQKNGEYNRIKAKRPDEGKEKEEKGKPTEAVSNDVVKAVIVAHETESNENRMTLLDEHERKEIKEIRAPENTVSSV